MDEAEKRDGWNPLRVHQLIIELESLAQRQPDEKRESAAALFHVGVNQRAER